MSNPLKAKLKQNAAFKSKAHEASLSLLVAAVHIRRQSEEIFKKHALNFNYYNVLRILRGAPEEGYPRCEIISRMIDPAPDVTRLMDQLVRKGWVRRERSDQDRRQSLHWITEAGRELLGHMDEEIDALSDEFAAQVCEEDLDHLIRIASKIYPATVELVEE